MRWISILPDSPAASALAPVKSGHDCTSPHPINAFRRPAPMQDTTIATLKPMNNRRARIADLVAEGFPADESRRQPDRCRAGQLAHDGVFSGAAGRKRDASAGGRSGRSRGGQARCVRAHRREGLGRRKPRRAQAGRGRPFYRPRRARPRPHSGRIGSASRSKRRWPSAPAITAPRAAACWRSTGICKVDRSARRRALRILDLGTGSGVLAIAAARALHRRVLATDIDAARCAWRAPIRGSTAPARWSRWSRRTASRRGDPRPRAVRS